MEELLRKFFEFPAFLLDKFIHIFHMDENLFTGAIPQDSRTPEEKSQDYPHEEVLGSGVPAIFWEPKTTWTVLPYREQIDSSSCGGQSSAKGLTAFNGGTIMSATPIYHFRANYPSKGMVLQDIGKILVKKHTTTEALCPSQNMHEEAMNNAVIPTDLPYGVSAYYFLPSGKDTDMDLIAVALKAGHVVIIGFGSTNTEYGAVPKYDGNTPTFHHYVTVVPENYLSWESEKAIVIDDSCAKHSTYKQTGQRIFTESFLKARSWGMMALVPVQTQFFGIPHCSLTKDLSYGLMNDPEVANLQDMLKVNGCMNRDIASTGNFLALTKQAVKKFQLKYASEILTPHGLTEATGYAGQYTREKLKSLFP